MKILRRLEITVDLLEYPLNQTKYSQVLIS